jgi:hypothetical protein
MSFEYWDPDEKDPPGYTSHWNPLDHDRLPPAVRISFEGLPGVASDIVTQEIPVNSFAFSGTTDPEEMMGEAPQDDKEGKGAVGGAGGATAQGGGGASKDKDADEHDEPDE